MMKLKNVLLSAAGLLLVVFVYAQSSADRRSQRADSAGNLKQMGLALLGYSGDYGGFFPTTDGAEGLNKLIQSQDLPLSQVYVNPRDGLRLAAFDSKAKKLTENTCSYLYLGSGLRDDNADSTTIPVVWEKPCGDDWSNVLFVDGHVAGYGGKFNNNVDVAKFLKKECRWTEQQYTFFLEKAKKFDAALGVPVDKLPKETVKALEELIAQLGADDFKTRRKAQGELKKHMPTAYQFLKKAMEKSDDPEVKERIKSLMYGE